jgi:CHAT domain-containing protein
LGRGLLLRHNISSSNDDLDQSILHLTEALFLPVRVSGKFSANITDIFSELASALVQRSKTSNKPEDANFAIQFLRYLRGQLLNKSGIPRYEVIISLIEALAIRAGLFGFDDGMQGIKDIITTCDELLSLDISEEVSFKAYRSLRSAISACGDGNRPVLDQCIKHLREACIRWPNSPALSIALAHSFVLRFDETLTHDNFEEATTILNRVLGSPSPGNSLDRWQQASLNEMMLLMGIRSVMYERPEYAEEAMSYFRSLSPFVPDSLRPDFMKALERTASLRFDYLGVTEASTLQETLSPSPKSVVPSSLTHLDAPRGDITNAHTLEAPQSIESVAAGIRDLRDRLSTTLPCTSDYNLCLKMLVRSLRTKISLTDDPTDIEEAIKYSRLLLESIPPGGVASCHASISLARFLKLAFDHTDNIEQLNESIGLLFSVLKVPAGEALCNGIVRSLISYLFVRDKFVLGTQNLHDPKAMQAMRQTIQTIIEILHLATDNKFTSVPSRLTHSFMLAKSLRYISHHGIETDAVSTAYEKAMSLMQDSVILSPNLQLQHSHLVAILQVEKMPLDYASHLINIRQHGQAIAILERGRALLWSELRGLRTSIQHIAGVDPVLAERFTAISRDLEKLTTSVLATGSSEVDGDNDGDGREESRGIDPFGRLLMKQRKLLEERDNIISQVRSLPGLQNFLMAPSFDSLRSAASHGPVIIINHSEWRSDILILLHNAPPSLIPTSESFYKDANKLRDDLVDAQKKRGLDSMEYDRTLASILEDLYILVGRPVINRLQELNIPEQSRVWWCPTSVFCSLPLHAMGPIPSNDGEKRYFSDLYIPSYTPTLSALIDSRNPYPQLQPSRKPSLLLVAQPDKTLPGVKGEISVIEELDIEVEGLILKGATTKTVLEGLRHHELVHFACHGNLEIGKPFDASFKLYGGQRLKLLDIVNSRLPHAEFAFLSACHTAELTEESIADEGLHLTAALQYCGFRSVIGTTWAMADTDGRDLARRVYHSMLSGNDEGPCYLRSAAALRDAVRELRNTSGVGLERWVNFVHYGA